MSAGDGYKYLLRTVAAGDGGRSLSTPLTRYYNEEGTPPGQWMGTGVASLSSSIRVRDTVTEAQLQLLIGAGRHPVTGELLGRAYPQYGGAQLAGRATRQRAVAGYDLTFSIPKSASVLWGIADAHTRARIVKAHHRAVAYVVGYLEREIAATRTGATAGDGAVAQVSVRGIMATAFDHFDSRAGDPHLHTHVVVSNKVKTLLDDEWRSLDGRPLHAAVVALSELHEAIFTDELTRALGVGWERREPALDRNPSWAIVGVPEELVAHFSSRSQAIDLETDKLIDAFATAHGRRPGAATIMKLRAQATLKTRPDKQLHSLAELTSQWQQQARDLLHQEPTSWTRALVARQQERTSMVSVNDLSPTVIADLGQAVVAAVADKRSTWRRWNLVAEAARQTMPLRFVSASDREKAVELVADAAEMSSIRLTPPELAESPPEFQRTDGSTVFRAGRSAIFTAKQLLEAESRLIERSRDTTAPRAPLPALSRRVGKSISRDQVAALEKIATSGRTVDVLVGAAGTGKTSAMRALRAAWERRYGRGSVVGLAPSAGAAHVLAQDLGIPTENLAKWWTDHLVRGERFSPGQLVIIDEASLAGTLSLDRISSIAADAGAKVLLVGDHAQLQAVDAGGAFALLAGSRDDAPELADVHRFTHDWEKRASLQLRDGDPDVIDDYASHGRITQGDSDTSTNAAYVAWRNDVAAGRASILIADSNDAVAALNARARAERILDGSVSGTTEVALRAGTAAAGDTVLTRRNDRSLRSGRGWVRNGDRWKVVDVLQDGRMLVRRADRRSAATITLPAAYVAEHVELGYAITAHRAQGVTVDTAHVLVQSGMTRESLYVAMTRGRHENTAHVALDRPQVSHPGPHPGEPQNITGTSVLRGVLQHVGAELSAHETMSAEQDRLGSVAQLAAEYETIAAAAQHDRWVALVESSALSASEVASVVLSDAFGSLTAALRRAEAHHPDVDLLFRAVVSARKLDDAEDAAAVLQSRVEKAVARQPGRQAPRLIAGLIPEALGSIAPDMLAALIERRSLLERRTQALVDRALAGNERWTYALGTEPAGATRVAWRRRARTVAAYRDRYGITGSDPLGANASTSAQERDLAAARAALEAAARLTRPDSEGNLPTRLNACRRSAPVR